MSEVLAYVRRSGERTDAARGTAASGFPSTSAERARRASVRVGVLVDLERSPKAGGHVKCWERLAEAAASRPEEIDLAVHFQGQGEREERLAANVRFLTHRPILSTKRLSVLSVAPDHTDLAPIHPGLLRRLGRYDVLHSTDAYFAFARTARVASRLYGIPHVNSIHTDTVGYTRLYSEKVIRRVAGTGVLGDFFVDRLGLPGRLAAAMRRRLERHIAGCQGVLLPDRAEYADLRGIDGPSVVASLGRGIDRDRFHPRARDRAAMEAGFGVPAGRFVVAFAGRIDQGKGVRLLTRAVRRLVEAGRPVHVVFAGRGGEVPSLQAQLGPHGSFPGHVDHDRMALLLASADAFVFPSAIEVTPNVVLEAKACGVPVVVAPSGGGVFIARDGHDGILVAGRAPEDWAAAIDALIADPALCRRLGAVARRSIETGHRSWDEVLRDDLMPVWRAVVDLHRAKDGGGVRTAHPAPDSASG